MKFFINGVNGQLGFDIVRELEKRGYKEYLATTKEDLDITNKKEVLKTIQDYKPDIIFHCAAYTAVDKAENDKENAYKINVTGTENILLAAQKIGAKIIYVSTDYVFDGTKDGLYEVNDSTNPINIYGQTKLKGEEIVKKYPKHFIARTSWVFGIHGHNFVKTMLKLSETKTEVRVINDQFGSPTYTVDLAKALVDLSLSTHYGTYHINNSGFCSWAEFADFIFKTCHKNVTVHAIPTSEYKTDAKRPMNSKLSKKSLSDHGFSLLPDWKDATKRYIEELNINGG